MQLMRLNANDRLDSDSLFQEVLLSTDDGSRSADSDPGYGFSCSEAEVFHQVAANESARTTQASCDWAETGVQWNKNNS